MLQSCAIAGTLIRGSMIIAQCRSCASLWKERAHDMGRKIIMPSRRTPSSNARLRKTTGADFHERLFSRDTLDPFSKSLSKLSVVDSTGT